MSPCTPNTIDLLTNTENTLRRLGDEGVSNRDNGRLTGREHVSLAKDLDDGHTVSEGRNV